MKRLLFICWDGPQVNYLEGLFLPIFVGLSSNYEIYILQFSWANTEKVSHLESICHAAGIKYTHFKIRRKPHPLLGSLFTLYKGTNFIKKFVRQHSIDIIMPRSTFPAAMTLSALRKQEKVKIVFDADGLPLEERVDFSGLNPAGVQYKLLKSIESKAIVQADVVITRTNAAIEYLVRDKPALSDKFFTVSNGRDINFFSDKNQRKSIRNSLGIPSDALVLIYAGSLGPQYCVAEMLQVYHEVSVLKKNTYLLILTGNQGYLKDSGLLETDNDKLIIKTVPFQKVPAFLAAADVALAIRQPTFSMQGVAPIKIGEYLLTKLPVVASAGIGDTEEILEDEMSCFVLKNHKQDSLKSAAAWAVDVYDKNNIKEEARALGIREFSLEKSIESYKIALSQLN